MAYDNEPNGNPDPQTTVVDPAVVPAQNTQNQELVPMQKRLTLTTMVTLANSIELITGVAEKILGNEVATSFAGASLNKDMISQLAQSVFQKEIAKAMGE